MRESLLVGSKTRAALKAHGVNVGAGALESLNEVVHWYIDQAAKRAAANRRKTVRAHDFIILMNEMEEEAGAEAPAPAAAEDAVADTGYGGGSADTESAVADAGEAAEEEPSPPMWSS